VKGVWTRDTDVALWDLVGIVNLETELLGQKRHLGVKFLSGIEDFGRFVHHKRKDVEPVRRNENRGECLFLFHHLIRGRQVRG